MPYMENNKETEIKISFSKNVDFLVYLQRFFSALLIFLFPLFFLAATNSFFLLPKKALLIFLSGLIFLLSLIRIIDLRQKKIAFILGKSGFWLLLLVISFVISIILNPNSYQNFLQTGLFFLFLWLLYFSVVNSRDRKLALINSYSLIASVTLLALFTIGQHLGLTNQLSQNQFFNGVDFSPAGSTLTLLWLLVLVLPLTLVFGLKLKNLVLKIICFILGGCQLSALILTASYLFANQLLRLLPLRAGWLIAVDSLKIKPLIGFGFDNFLTAFTQFRPAFLNLSPFWNWTYTDSTNLFLQFLTTGGLVGLTLFVLLIITSIHSIKTRLSASKPEYLLLDVGLIMLFFLGLLMSFNLIFWLLLFVFLGLLEARHTEPKKINLSSPQSIWLTKIILILLVAGVFTAWYLTGRVLAADIAFQKSTKALAANQGKNIYDFQKKAIELSPTNIGYRLSFSQTNLLLANSLAGQETLSDQQKTQISLLIQQAVDEAKIAVNLNPQNSFAWQNLAELYHNLINFAEGADNWTIAAYQQTIRLNPTDPRLRVDLGGIFYSLKNFETAIDQFRRAAELKPDYANAYYNLSQAYKETKEFEKAYLAMQQVVNLIPIDSQDFQKASQELEELKTIVTPEEAPTEMPEAKIESELTEPEPLPEEPAIGPIELPGEPGPEELNPEELPEETETEETESAE